MNDDIKTLIQERYRICAEAELSISLTSDDEEQVQELEELFCE